MVIIKCRKGIERFAIESKPYEVLQRAKQKLREDNEVWFAFFGERGSGKSLKAMHYAMVVDPSFEGAIDRVCFDKEEFINAILKADKYQVIIADEAISIFFSRAAMTKESRLIMELCNQIRQKNLCIMLCIPNVTDLDSSILNDINILVNVKQIRTKVNTEIKTLKGNVRGWINFPSSPLARLVINHYKAKRRNPMYKCRLPIPNFAEKGNRIGKNCKKPWYPINEQEYRGKKESVLYKYKETDKIKENTDKIQRDFVILKMKELTGLSNKKLSKEMCIPETTIRDSIRRASERISSNNGDRVESK